MSELSEFERRVGDFECSIREIMRQFQRLHSVTTGDPSMNLGHHDFAIIEHLGESGPVMTRALAEILGLAVNSVTPIIDSLENRGLVLRARSETDRRVVNVSLSQDGDRAYEFIRSVRHQFHVSMFSALTPDEQEILLVLFRKIARQGSVQVKELEAIDRTSAAS